MIETISIVFYLISIVSYLAAFGIFLSRFSSDKDTSPYGNRLLMIGLVFQIVSFGLRYISTGMTLSFHPYEVIQAITLILVAEALLVEFFSGVQILGLYISPIASMLLLAGWFNYHQPQVATGILKSNWVITHATLVFLSYGAFIISAGFSLLYLVQEKQVKDKNTTGLMRFLPSLKALEETSFRAAAIGFTLLSVSLIMGIIYASKFWHVWDMTMIVSAGVMWAVFLFYLFSRIRLGWMGRKSSYVALIGLLTVLIMHFIVIQYLTKIHIYGG